MQITDIRVRVLSKESKMKAVVSVTFDEAFVIHDIKVIEGEKGLFIAMPSKKTPDGEYRDMIVTPKNIDSIINDCSGIIAYGINTALHRNITAEEIADFMY